MYKNISKIKRGVSRMLAAPLFVISILLLLPGCLKNEVDVEFEIQGVALSTCQLQYYASDSRQGWFVETAATIQNGKGAVKLITRNPTIVYVTVSAEFPEAAFYAERGDKITVQGSSPSPFEWKIGGNSINEEWTAWRLENKNILMNREPMALNAAVAKYVKKNADNPLATIILLLYYNRNEDETGFQKLFASLEGDARDAEWVNLVSGADMVNGDFPEAEGVKNLVIGSAGNGVDTVVMGTKPVMLFFWRGSDNTRSEGIEALRRLANDFPDSASRVLADICFDPDSVAWRFPMQGDSLRKVIRGWNPIGECDSVISRLRVMRTPYIIVYDRKGKESYRGSDFPKGEESFRKVMNKK